MQNNPTEHLLAAYLQQLNTALSDQDAALIQDALYDAEEHLRAALEENDNFDAICHNYGSPKEIADFYRDMELRVNLAMSGPKNIRRLETKNRFFNILSDADAYRAMVYMALALPLGIVYFAWVMMVGVNSLFASVLIFGIPIFLVFLASMQFFALFEGRLIELLLNQRMPRRPHYQLKQAYPTRWKQWAMRLRYMLSNRNVWTTALYLLLKLPIGIAVFALIISSAILSIALMISPIVDPLMHLVDPSINIDVNWYWFPLAMPGGAIGLTISLHLAKITGRQQARLARYLLVSNVNDI